MIGKTINGFILDEPEYNDIQPVYVFAATDVSLPVSAVTYQSFVESTKSNCEVIFLTKKLASLDYERIEKISKDNACIQLRIYPLDSNYKTPYIDMSEYNLDDDIVFFLPYILKRYNRAIYIQRGTIVEKEWEPNRDRDLSVYVDDKDNVLALYYNIKSYIKNVTINKIHHIITQRKGGILLEYFNAIIEENIEEYRGTEYLQGINEGRYSNTFIEYARRCFFYEKLQYDYLTKPRLAKKKKLLRYLFPYEALPHGKKVVIYGYGVVGKQYIQQMEITKYCQIVGVVDRDYITYQRKGYDILPVSSLNVLEYDYIIIAIADAKIMKSILEILLELNIPSEKIICSLEREWFMEDMK